MDRNNLMIKVRALMLDIIGAEIYHIDVDEDIREKKSFDQSDEQILKESINKEFNVNIDITSLKPLTLNQIVYYIKRGSATPTHSRSDRCRSFGAPSQKSAKNKVSGGISKKEVM
jgi:hypothetical protein